MGTTKLVMGLALSVCWGCASGVKAQPPAPQPQKPPLTVFVLGEVTRPGVIELDAEYQRVNLIDIIAIAGGVKSREALAQITIQRGENTATMDANALLQGGGILQPVIQDGDIITVGKKSKQVVVSGMVIAPGPQPLPEDVTLSAADALALAGGPWPIGDLEIVLLRQAANGKVERRSFKPQAGERKFLERLQAGDMVAVIKATK